MIVSVKHWLAMEFLNRIERQEQAKEFLGSWFSIQGKKQTGYFLGHEFIRALEKTRGLKETALLKPKRFKNLR
jgi:hypothetical protein